MPEVIEVSLTAYFLHHNLKNKLLKKFQILGGRYSKDEINGLQELQKELKNYFYFKKVDSKGKLLWFELENEDNKNFFIINRFGLEGEWSFLKNEHTAIMLEVQDPKTDDVFKVYFSDSRHFGTFEITNDKKILMEELNKIAPDFIKTDFDSKELKKRIQKILFPSGKVSTARAKWPIVKVLMEQNEGSSIGSGLGNYLAAEVLYLAEISPRSTLNKIYNESKLIENLTYAIKFTLKLSLLTADIGYLAHLDPNMKNYILKKRKSVKFQNIFPEIDLGNKKFKFNVYRQKKDPLGNPVKADKIILGRTTYWVKEVQK